MFQVKGNETTVKIDYINYDRQNDREFLFQPAPLVFCSLDFCSLDFFSRLLLLRTTEFTIFIKELQEVIKKLVILQVHYSFFIYLICNSSIQSNIEAMWLLAIFLARLEIYNQG